MAHLGNEVSWRSQKPTTEDFLLPVRSRNTGPRQQLQGGVTGKVFAAFGNWVKVYRTSPREQPAQHHPPDVPGPSVLHPKQASRGVLTGLTLTLRLQPLETAAVLKASVFSVNAQVESGTFK